MVVVRHAYDFLTYLVLTFFLGPHSEIQKACLAHAERIGTYLSKNREILALIHSPHSKRHSLPSCPPCRSRPEHDSSFCFSR